MMSSEESRQSYTVLVINPGSTSTKVALFEGTRIVCSRTLSHSSETLARFKQVTGQLAFRESAVSDFVTENSIALDSLDAIAVRGGLLKPIPGGTYRVSANMLKDLRAAVYGEHAGNLGALLADRIGTKQRIPAFIVDPITTDEFEPHARISGVPGIDRKCRNHALNIKAVARRVAVKTGRPLSETGFVVAHMGGGVSVCALKGGRIVDSTDGLLGEGPFSMDRAGTIAAERIIEMCFDQNLTRDQIVRRLAKESGFKGYLGETDLPTIQERIEKGDQKAAEVMDAFVQQVAKWIGAMSTVFKCRADAIIITGGMANSSVLIDNIKAYIKPLAPLEVFPGELEMEALAEGAIRVLDGVENSLSY